MKKTVLNRKTLLSFSYTKATTLHLVQYKDSVKPTNNC